MGVSNLSSQFIEKTLDIVEVFGKWLLAFRKTVKSCFCKLFILMEIGEGNYFERVVTWWGWRNNFK